MRARFSQTRGIASDLFGVLSSVSSVLLCFHACFHIHPLLVDDLHTLWLGFAPIWASPQSGFALAKCKRVILLRVRPHKTKADVVAAIRGRVGEALRNAGGRRGVAPRAATDHPAPPCRWSDWISRWQCFIVPLIPVPNPPPYVAA